MRAGIIPRARAAAVRRTQTRPDRGQNGASRETTFRPRHRESHTHPGLCAGRARLHRLRCVPISIGMAGAGEIRLGNLEIERGLAKRLVLGEDDLLGRIAVAGFETVTVAGFGIDAVELMALTATDETETFFHRHGVQPTKEVNRVVTV